MCVLLPATLCARLTSDRRQCLHVARSTHVAGVVCAMGLAALHVLPRLGPLRMGDN